MIVPNLPKTENYNPYGFIFEDKFFITREYGLTSINLNEIKSVKIANSRDMKINFFSILFSVITLYFTFFYFEYNFIYKIISTLIIIPFLIVSVIYKKHHYKLIVITNNYQFILTNVDKNTKKQAEDLVLKINYFLISDYNELKAC